MPIDYWDLHDVIGHKPAWFYAKHLDDYMMSSYKPPVGKIIVKTRDPAPVQADLRRTNPQPASCRFPRAPSHDAAIH